MFDNASWKVVDMSLIVNFGNSLRTFTKGSKEFNEEKTMKMLVEIFGDEKATYAMTKLMNAEPKKVESKAKEEKRKKIAKEFTPEQIAEFKKLGIIK